MESEAICSYTVIPCLTKQNSLQLYTDHNGLQSTFLYTIPLKTRHEPVREDAIDPVSWTRLNLILRETC